MNPLLPFGIYDSLLDKTLRKTLERFPELRAVLGKIDAEEQPARYAAFIARVVEQALREEVDPEKRVDLCNSILEQVTTSSRDHLEINQLIPDKKSVLLEITPPHYGTSGLPRPHTPISESSLFTGSPRDPQLVHELQAEMISADAVDILVSFIKWSGLRLLMPAFEELRNREIPVRLITTSYMGASDAPAIEWLAGMPNVNVRVSYDTERTRLHAKADKDYNILIFARSQKKQNGCTLPFTYLGSAEKVSFEGERPIKMVWRLRYPMPVEMFEENRKGG